MAKEIKRTTDRKLVAALDIGASKAACVIAHLTESFDGDFEVDVVGVGQNGASLRDKTPDSDAAIRAAVEAAERMAGERIRLVHVAAGGRSLTTRKIGVDLDIEGGVVTREDIADCLDQGARAAAPDGATPLHAMKIRFALDGEPAPEDPAGLAGAVLNAEIFGVGVKNSYVANVESKLARAGLELDEIVAGPFAAAEAVLIDDEKELGVLLLDIGARTTSYALFERGALVGCGGVGVGGDHITRDIAQIFGSPIAHAERMKTLHGSALTGPGDEHRLLDFPQLGDSAEVARHSKAELAQVIAPRFEEIVEMTLAALPGGAGARRGVRRAVLTGGGSLLVGARETAERMIGVKTRLGRPAPLSGAPEAATAPQFAVAFGVLRHAARLRSEKIRATTRPRLKAISASGRGVIGGVGQWLKANF
ncbi:MAG: cell division protein FtsA [Parvularculaceae bacterium]|nr:cell division protein FtsA [Parvularculaceae bacterium]